MELCYHVPSTHDLKIRNLKYMCIYIYMCVCVCVCVCVCGWVGPCHHGMARPQVADGGTASDMEGSCE